MFYIRNLKFFRTSCKYVIRGFSSKVKLHINPVKCLQDEPIHIAANNLPPNSNVTLVSTIKDDRENSFLTHTHYRSDVNGTIDLSRDPSLDGTYKGVFPMGPIGAFTPAPNTYKYIRYMKGDVTTPLVVNFKLLNGHVNEDKAAAPDPNIVLDSVQHERIYMTEGTTRIPVREGRIRGTLFIPKGEGPFPGVIDVYGASGGLLEYKAAQFAAHGIASLTLAYFGFEDLPKTMNEIDLSYFEESVDYLHSHPKVKKCGVGAIGVSKGGDIVCSMGAFLPKVKAVVSVNGLGVNALSTLKYKDTVIPGLSFSMEKVKILGDNLINIRDTMNDSEDYPETHIPMHKSNAEFLFICAEDDGNWKTVVENERAVARMKANGKTNYEVIKYDGAGHMIDPAYAPFSFATFHRIASSPVSWGGNAKDHTAAQVDSWRRILEFFKRVIV